VLVVGTHSVHVRRFVAGLCTAGHPVVLATDQPAPLVEHPLLREQIEVDFAVRRLATPAKLRACIARWQPRVVHAHQGNSVAWHAARGAADTGVPLVLTLWGSDVLLTPQISRFHRWMVRSSLRAAALWTADSAHVLRRARALAGVARPTALVVMGVDHRPEDLRSAWPDKQPRILSCRLHKPLYRVDRIITAYAELAPRHPGWRLEVAASGPQTQALTALARGSGAAGGIEFTGFLDASAMVRSHRAAQVYVSFPESDGTSVSLLEAMAQGCCPVVSDLAANREWIVDGLNGVVVAQPEDLAAAIERAIAMSGSERWREETAPANLRLVREKATFADNIAQFIAQYARLGR
jgi:glycosyltransferase involved in cell wall biosynthesis